MPRQETEVKFVARWMDFEMRISKHFQTKCACMARLTYIILLVSGAVRLFIPSRAFENAACEEHVVAKDGISN